MDSHAAVAVKGMDQEIVDAVLKDWKSAGIDGRTRAALSLLETMTLSPQELNRAYLIKLESMGLSEIEMEEIASVAFHFNFINRVTDAVNFPVPSTRQAAKQANVLNLMARFATGGKAPAPSWSREADSQVRPAELQEARNHLLMFSGELTPELRRSVEGVSAALWHAKRPSFELPQVVDDFVRPLSLHAYRIHDELVSNLQEAGYSNKAIFELTLMGAFGAALAGQEHLFQAMYE